MFPAAFCKHRHPFEIPGRRVQRQDLARFTGKARTADKTSTGCESDLNLNESTDIARLQDRTPHDDKVASDHYIVQTSSAKSSKNDTRRGTFPHALLPPRQSHNET